MQQKEYAQVSEFGLGSLIGDFFENVKDVVGDVAKAAAPIAPFVLPFLPGGPLLKLGIGAGLGLASGQKPVEVAKNLALQAALTGVAKNFTATPQATVDTASTVAQGGGDALPFLSDLRGDGIVNTVKETPSFFGDFTDATKEFFTSGGGSRLNPFSDASRMNPKYFEGLAANLEPADLFKLGISPERGLVGRFGPLATAVGLGALPFLARTPDAPEEEEEEYNFVPNEYYYGNELAYQLPDIVGPQGYIPDLATAKQGGEVTGFAAGSGRKIKHEDGKVREHPKRIGEIAGKGTGTSDDIPAMLSDGEFVMTAKAVRNAGGGSRKAGAKKMYQMMKNLEKGGSFA